jgi:hypothetical protein
MKKINFPLVVIMLVAFAAANFAGKNPSKEAPIAIVMKIVKDVNFKKGEEGAWTAIKIGQALATGDEIKTGAKSLALIKFTDNSILRVRENCTIKIYADKNNKQVSKNTYIGKGDVNFEVTKQQNEEFQFTTPTMVASIRGTKGLIGVEDDGSSSLLVEEGSVDFMSTVGDQKKGNVRGGNFAQVDKEGQVDEGAISADLQKKLESSKKTNTKKIIIQTNQGNLIIEYLEE